MRACVTGASGYLASELVFQLLFRGWNVIGTVRSLSSVEKLQHLFSFQEQYPNKLELVEADLLLSHSFDEAVSRSDVVFHTASPFSINVADPIKELLQPALDGTRNVLGSVILHKQTVRRVVLTSSLAAVRGMGSSPTNGSFFTEDDWNETSNISEGGISAYMASKVLAEKEAWNIARENGFELSVINPSFILGPPQLKTRENAQRGGTSLGFMLHWIECGENPAARCVADVRDVALAHILAAESPNGVGRFIVSTDSVVSQFSTSQFLSNHFNGSINIVTQCANTEMPKICDSGRLRSVLGLQLRSPEETIVDMARTMIESGMAIPNSRQVTH